MNDEINYKANPLHGVSLKNVLIEMVDHYGFEILFAYLNINCFKTNPSIESSVIFLKKTEWAREKVEAFYLYQLKNLPKASDENYQLPPRDRVVPADQLPGEPAELSLDDAAVQREKRARKSAAYDRDSRGSYSSQRNSRPTSDRDDNDTWKDNEPTESSDGTMKKGVDPWAKWR